MKKLFYIIFWLLFASNAFAQDLIVTNEGDSLNCKITEVKNDYVYFTFKIKGEVRNTLLSGKQIRSTTYNFYKDAEIQGLNTTKEGFPHYKFSITGGYSYRTAKNADNLPASYEKYVDKLRSGFHLDADFIYYFKETFGIGMKYNYDHTKNVEKNLTIPDRGIYDIVEDNISINFAGPSCSFRTFNFTKKNNFFMNIALGYLGYSDSDKLGYEDMVIKSSTLGMVYDIGYDIGISENVALGLQLSYLTGTLTKLEIRSGPNTQTVKLEKENYENLGRLDISVGFRFNWL